MVQLLNQFSFPLISVIILIGAFLALHRLLKWSPRKVLVFEVALLIVVVVVYIGLRPGRGDVQSLSEADNILSNGQPSFVEFFSNYCTGCLLIRPFVDEKITEIQDEFNILRIDIHTEIGQGLKNRYGFTYTPEFLLIDGNGEVVWRGSTLPTDADLALVRN